MFYNKNKYNSNDMKNQYAKAILVTIITTLVSTLLLVFISILKDKYNSGFEDNNIYSSEIIKIDSINFSQTITVNNFCNKSLIGLAFGTEDGRIVNIIYNRDIKLKIINPTEFKIEKIFPNSSISFTVQSRKSLSDSFHPVFYSLNDDELNIDFSFIYEKKNYNWVSILYTALFYSLLFGVVLGISEFISNKRYKYLRDVAAGSDKQLQTAENIINDLRKSIDKTEKNVIKNRITFNKIKLLLIKKGRDLETENIFYRKLLIKLLETKHIRIQDDEIFEIVRDELKTHSTRTGFTEEINSIDIISSIISPVQNED